MNEELLIRHCCPTLAGIKTGSLFSCRYSGRRALRADIAVLDRRLRGRGLRLLALRARDGLALLYLYRPAALARDLRDPQARALLEAAGYAADRPALCLIRLIRRLHRQADFPHEIGLFLGYPPQDVQGFIRHRAAGCRCSGCWKVYGDAQAAQRTFCQYRRCSCLLGALWRQGVPIERLTAAC